MLSLVGCSHTKGEVGHEEGNLLAGRACSSSLCLGNVSILRAEDQPALWVVIMWDQIAEKAKSEGRAHWDALSRDEQAKIISSWTDHEGRVEFLIDCPADIIGMVAAMYVSHHEDRKTAMAELGKMVCATFAVAARKSVENLWSRT